MAKFIILFFILVMTMAGVVFGRSAIITLDTNSEKSSPYPEERLENPELKKPAEPGSPHELFYVPDTLLIYLYS